jgi:hypothetical protein
MLPSRCSVWVDYARATSQCVIVAQRLPRQPWDEVAFTIRVRRVTQLPEASAPTRPLARKVPKRHLHT